MLRLIERECGPPSESCVVPSEAEAPGPNALYAVHRIKGFMRVRHFGFLANRCRVRCLALIRAALTVPAPEPAAAPGGHRTL